MNCDLNCDMGEGIGNDEAIFPYITSANVACGYHAGDATTMKETILLAKKYNVAIGAHPSFLDRENFGRTEIKSITPQEVYDLVLQQLRILHKVALENRAELHHMKPHGALYNMAAKDAKLSKAIAHALFDFNKSLVLFGLSGSFLISEAKAMGLKTASEVFADRTYQDDGNLTPRTMPGALIHDELASVNQVLQMLKDGKVTSITGNEVSLEAETICLHSDGANAVNFAKAIHEKLLAEKIGIKAI